MTAARYPGDLTVVEIATAPGILPKPKMHFSKSRQWGTR